MKESLVDHVRKNVDPKAYYSSVFPEIRWPDGAGQPRVMCPFHNDKATPSLHFNGENGAWFCHGCKAGGRSIISFHQQYNSIDRLKDAAEDLFSKYIHPTIPNKEVRRWAQDLKKTPSALQYLRKKRLLDDDTITRWSLGYNGRIVFPIKNEFGLWVNAKGFDPLWKKGNGRIPKMVNHSTNGEKRNFGSPVMLWPLEVMDWAQDEGYVFVCEGEFDCLFLLSLGLPAVTTTGGSKSWPEQYNEKFRGLKVIIAYDNDQDGMKYDRRVVLKNLKRVAKKVIRLHIPKVRLPDGTMSKDVLEWGIADPRMRTGEAWLKATKKHGKVMVHNADADNGDASETTHVPLAEATNSKYFNQRLVVDALVTGKDNAPYLLPQEARINCSRSCDTCPMAERTDEYKTVKLDPTDPKILAMVDSSEREVRAHLLRTGGIDPKPSCGGTAEITKTFNVEHIHLIPTLDANSAYCIQSCYYVGHGLKSNRAYTFDGTTVPHPRDHHATHLFDAAKAAQDEIESFRMTPELREKLEKTFGCPKDADVLEWMYEIAAWQIDHVTHIKERQNLHVAVDLAYHSVASFVFNGEVVKRAMLDILILGDTRCGKGYVAEGLKRHYGIGEVASGETCTYAGLVGGVQRTTRGTFFITWGAIPLNNGRAVIIDEASALTYEQIGKMSRIRSEGIAELIKVVRESTQANTRLIWISNPREGRKVEDFDEGVQAIPKLMGANEDVARFDFAMIVKQGEVSANTINTIHTMTGPETNGYDRFPGHLCRSLILWAWSRTPEQVQFTTKATAAIINKAIRFGETYASNIPLVQGENIRIKLAKVSAAVAARTFSSDESGENVVVTTRHVRAACDFIESLYRSPGMAYDLFSKRILRNSKLRVVDDHAIDKMFDELGDHKSTAIQGLMSMHRVTPEALTDYVGDPVMGREFLGKLVRVNAMSRMEGSNCYLKNPAFAQWLRSKTKTRTNHANESHLARRD